MSSIGTGYDLQASTFSPDGRIFQVEYAQKAVDNSGTAIGLRCSDGVIVAVEKPIVSKLEVDTSKTRVFNITAGIGCAGTGMYADLRSLVSYAKNEALDFMSSCRQEIYIEKLVSDTAWDPYRYTLGISRPYGCAAMFASYNAEKGGRLFVLDPAGQFYEYSGWAVGKHRQGAKAEVEKLDLKTLTVDQAMKELARIMISVRDENKDQEFKLEMGWTTKQTKGKFIRISDAQIKEAEEWAKKKMEEEDSDGEMQS